MLKLLRQELFKLGHRRLPWWIIILLPLFMLIIGVGMRSSYNRLLVMSCFSSSDIIMLILVIVGSTIFSMEFQNKTILPLLYHSPNRTAVFAAKFLTLLIYNIFLHLVAVVLTILSTLTPLLSHPVVWTAVFEHHQPLWINLLACTGVDVVQSTLIISLICLASCLINSNTWVIMVNAVIIFMGKGFSTNLIMAKVSLAKIIRWNPFNMLNLTLQYYNYGSYHPTSMLSNGQLLWGTLAYALIFTLCAYWAFAKKKF